MPDSEANTIEPVEELQEFSDTIPEAPAPPMEGESLVEASDAPPAPSAQSIKVDREAATAYQKDGDPSQEMADYWCGTLPSCPMQNVTISGVDFPRFHGAINTDQNGNVTSGPKRGRVHRLSKEHVERILAGAVKKVVRTGVPQPSIYDTGATRVRGEGQRVSTYSRHRGDLPLASFLYMVPLNGGVNAHDWREKDPEPML